MRNIYLFCIFLIAAPFFFACTGNASAKTGSENAGGISGSTGDSVYSGSAMLAYTTDGRKTNIKNYLQTGGKNWLALFMNEVSRNASNGLIKINLTNELTKEVFDFVVDGKGTTSFNHYQPTVFNFRGKTASYMSPKYQNYYANDASITITSSDATHVTGTFSGKFKSDDGKTIQLTEGSFDVPFGKQ